MADLDAKTAESEQLQIDITKLSDDIAEIKKAQAEATALRQEEKEKNAGIIADAQTGTAAVEKALKVLKDFYDKAAAALLQGGTGIKQEMAATQDSGAPYKGMQDESTGVLGMLE